MCLAKKVYLLMSKNWLLQKKKICVTIFEVLIPTLIAFVFVLARSSYPEYILTDSVYYKESFVLEHHLDFPKNATIGYVPKTIASDMVMNNTLMKLRTLIPNISFSILGFMSEKEAVYFHKRNSERMTQIFVFHIPNENIMLPKNIKISIRPGIFYNEWHTADSYPFDFSGNPRKKQQAYIVFGFLFLQTIIGHALLQYWLYQVGRYPELPVAVLTKCMATPSYYDDPLALIIQNYGSLNIILSFVLSAIVNTKMLVYEKEWKIKELLSVMGLSPLAQRIAWFLTLSSSLIPTMALFSMTFCLKISRKGPVLLNSDGILFFFFLLCYAFALITFCFMISAFVNKATTGAVLSGIAFFAFYLPYIYINVRYAHGSRMIQIIYCLSFNCAMSIGMKIISIYESQGLGVQWDNFYKPAVLNDNFTLLNCMLMLLLDSGIHIFIAWYMENVMPGEFGIPKPYYFCFTKNFWIGKSPMKPIDYKSKKTQRSNFEKEPTGKIVGIHISKLYKKFGPNIVVNGITLNMYEGQLMALLGHNGAGKTTTMSMLTGFIPATSGTVVINNYDIKINLEGARKSLGVCPQNDVLFDTLTVYEHLMFFAKVKDIKTSELKSEVKKMAKNVELENELKTMARNLSGGQRRKLSVAIALIGGSKFTVDFNISLATLQCRRPKIILALSDIGPLGCVKRRDKLHGQQLASQFSSAQARALVLEHHPRINISANFRLIPPKRFVQYRNKQIHVVILDEPTSGMDPAARHHMRNVLKEARKGRTILMSTQYMDEADILGDRIAIMVEGVVKCCGSPLFLKKLYGTGYHLVVLTKKNCDVPNLTNFIKSFIPNAGLETVRNTEVTYLLPDSESRKFSNLFHKLENEKMMLKIESFGTSAKTLEEVFLKVAEKAQFEEKITVPVNMFDDFKSSRTNSFEALDPEFVSTNLSLVVVKKSDCDVVNLTSAITNFIPSAEIANMTPTEVIYSFPESGQNIIRDLLYNLENNMEELGIESLQKSFGALKAGWQSDLNYLLNDLYIHPNQGAFVIVDSQPLSFNTGFIKKSGLQLQLYRMYGIFSKKLICTWRKRSVTIPQMFIPVSIALLVSRYDSRGRYTEPPLNFDLLPFGETYIPYTDGINPTTSHTAFANLYARQFNSTHKTEFFKIGWGETFDNYTLNRADDLGITIFNKKMIIGMEVIQAEPFKNIVCVAYYNGQPYHASAISVNYLLNTILQFVLNDTFSIQTAISPIPTAAVSNKRYNFLNGETIGLFISFGMTIMTTLFILFLIQEREVGAKHIQTICGVDPLTYWLPTFLLDFTIYMLTIVPVVVVFAMNNLSPYIDGGRWELLIIVLILYGWAVLPHLYAFQFLFKSAATGVSFGITFSIFTGVITNFIIHILDSALSDRRHLVKRMDFMSMILFPTYNLGSCLKNIYDNYNNLEECLLVQPHCFKELKNRCCRDTCGNVCLHFHSDYTNWDKPGIGELLFYMFLQGLLYFLIVLIIEYHIIKRIWYGIFHNTEDLKGVSYIEDRDVAAERQRIISTRNSLLLYADSLVLVNLYKRYRNLVAVDNICLGIPDQECFGLLGHNGAGKTAIFKMLTGDVMVTGGNAYLKGFDVKNNIQKVQAQIGYCPQFDALINDMTGRETLTLYARLRGIPEDKIQMVVEMLADSLMITSHIDKYVRHYSGGNKRKLSTAVALIGNPTFVMLDEPSAGLDPEAKRHLWSLLSQLRASGCTLVIASHSMDECYALCTRLAIMVNGRFVCLGSPQHLKNKFGQGYTLITHLKTSEDGTVVPNEPVIDFLTSHFHGAKVFDDHQGYIHFQVPDTNVKLAEVFDIMETAKLAVNVKDYSVHQTTLEQIFLTFTRTQVAPTIAHTSWNPFSRFYHSGQTPSP